MLKPSYLINEKFDDVYFDVVNALDEAQHNFFSNNNLLSRIKNSIESNTPLIIGETGFGAGRVLVCLMEYIEKAGLKNVSIEYYSVELYPISPEKMKYILNGLQENALNEQVNESIETLLYVYKGIDISKSGWHIMPIKKSFGTITVNLWIGEALEMLTSLNKPCDVWFLDGHSPNKNPEMWRPELLMSIGQKTKKGGSCATYTVAGSVRNALKSAGFIISKLPGCNGKKEVLQGIKG